MLLTIGILMLSAGIILLFVYIKYVYKELWKDERFIVRLLIILLEIESISLLALTALLIFGGILKLLKLW